MRRKMRKCVSLLLLIAMLMAAAVPAAAAGSGAGVGWSDGEKGFDIRITSYGGEVSRVTAGEQFTVQLWIRGSDPAAVSVPLRWNPSVAVVVDESTGIPVSTGRKEESDLVRGAGFRPGDKCYDNSMDDNYAPLYWNGKPVFTQRQGTGAAGYPYINNETGFAKFLYYTNSPTKGSEEQMFLEVTFKAISAGDPQFRFATSAEGSGAEDFDPGSPKGMQVSFAGAGDGNIDDIDEVSSEVYTRKVKFPSFRITDGSELQKPPTVPPVNGKPGEEEETADTLPPQDEVLTEGTLKATAHLTIWPYGEPAECTAQIERSDDEKLLKSDEYAVSDNALYGAMERAVGGSASSDRANSAASAAGSTKPGSERAVLIRMPEKIIDKDEYAVSLSSDPVLDMGKGGVTMLYVEAPAGYVGVDIEAVAEKLKSDTTLRISASTAPGGESGMAVSLESDGAEIGGFSKPALRLLLPYEAKIGTADPSVMTNRPFGSRGNKAPLSVCRYDGEKKVMLVQAPAGGTVTVAEQEPLVFTDLGNVAWAKADIDRLSQKGIVSGTGAGTFSPEKRVTREQFAKMATAAFSLYEANPPMPFGDVARDNPFYIYIASAKAKGIVSGTSAKQFGGAGEISRQDLAVMVYKSCEKAGVTLPVNRDIPVFSDDSGIAPYAKTAVYALAKAGIISGAGENRFNPKGSATRAEACRILGAASQFAETLL